MNTSEIHSPAQNIASYGVLENCLSEANIFMSLLKDLVDRIEVTGELRIRYANGHTSIELLAIPKKAFNLLGESHPTNELHEKLIQIVDDLAWIKDEPPNYEWEGKRYLWKLTLLNDESQWTIAQLIHTGPAIFSKWITSSSQHRGGALPWGYKIKDYILFDNNDNALEINSESEFFKTLGYLPISLVKRSKGYPDYWRSFKRVPNLEGLPDSI